MQLSINVEDSQIQGSCYMYCTVLSLCVCVYIYIHKDDFLFLFSSLKCKTWCNKIGVSFNLNANILKVNKRSQHSLLHFKASEPRLGYGAEIIRTALCPITCGLRRTLPGLTNIIM